MQQLLDAMTGVAVVVGNGRRDCLAANAIGRAFFVPLFDGPARGSSARFTFLDPRARDAFTAEPGSPSADALSLLARWMTPTRAPAEESAGDPSTQ